MKLSIRGFDVFKGHLDGTEQADLEEPLQRVNEALNETVRTVMAR